MTRLIALAGLAAYVCQTPIEHNGDLLPVGSPIELGQDAAQALLDVHAIGHSDGNAPQALQAAQQGTGGTDGVAALLADLDQRDTQIAALRVDLAELHQAVADQASAHAAELENLREKLAAENATSRDLQAQLDAAKAGLAGAELKATDLEAANQQLRTEATAAAAQLTALQAQLDKAKAATGTAAKRAR